MVLLCLRTARCLQPSASSAPQALPAPCQGDTNSTASPPHCLRFELFCTLLLYIRGTQPTPIGELIADRADGKMGPKKYLVVFLSCEGNIGEKGCVRVVFFHFLRAVTKVKSSFYDQWSLRNNYPAPVNAYLTSGSAFLLSGSGFLLGMSCAGRSQTASSICSRHQRSERSTVKQFKTPKAGANS